MAAAGAGPKPGGGEALVSFVTKLPDAFQVPEEELVVPSNLERYGLSEVVNRLLAREKSTSQLASIAR
ncbi:Ribosome biogenesis protein WDR12-like [Symbiodinium microadriaticum]|uniref:Ribosome biogenesis protein WDR12-like n=1 Tax=Symbiodinium microadriaticum TaxID=2951 RepID=A0A1Q9DJC8_SYMMI|nr:Ribosome biogenesis protein WDR12-like [Symbiodinium microadriaticum]